ncbi:MAG: hypothetical protein IJ506_01310 [Clostridia bacterium]|nr:hypothetical protein [Clostridia bacterium]MBQ8657750.1 hypothetical protein [Clostridia bacterium]
MSTITIDFSKPVGEMKDVNGVNCAPYVLKRGADQILIKKYFGELHTSYSRLHDCEGRYGGCNYVDIPNIFRDFDADETDEKNYDFYYTDEYIKGIVDAGAKIVYRLGITIEWGSKKYRTYPPKDMAKWARICEHVIKHYNEGWANGFHYGIEYWEIWNEPENPPMWSGTMEEFFDLYKTAAVYLKEKFPNIKVGGYGSCGFYAITSRKDNAFYQSFLTWFHEFLKMCKAENVPLDFYTWHLYTGDFDEFLTHAKYVRDTLDSYGFEKVESHFNEWNVGGEGGGFHLMRNMIGASYIAAVLCELQNTDYVDKAMYYVFTKFAGYNGFLDLNVGTPTCTYYAMRGFGEVYARKTQVAVEKDEERLRAAAACDGETGAAILSNYDCEKEDFLLKLQGVKKGAKVVLGTVVEKGEPIEEIFEWEGESFEKQIKMPKNSVLTVKVQ